MAKVIDQVKADAKFEANLDKMFDHLENAHNPEKALTHFEAKLENAGANVFIADPSDHNPSPVYGTPGQHDVFIYDYAAHADSSSLSLRNFTPGEDHIVLVNMGGTELDMGSLGNNQGSFGVFFHSYPDIHGDFATSTLISMGGITYDQDVLQHTILGVSNIKYDGAFDIG